MINTLTRWEPLREMEDFQNRLSTLFGRPQRRTNGHGREEITLADWMPLADITEDEKEYLIKAELPDGKKEDVKVTVENVGLTSSGERKFDKEEKKQKFHRKRSSCSSRPRTPFTRLMQQRISSASRGGRFLFTASTSFFHQ